MTRQVYWQTLLRSMWIAARVMIFSLLLGYPLAYFLSFHAGRKKDLYYQLVIIPLWVSYLVRAYAWKTILGTDGVLNTFFNMCTLPSIRWTFCSTALCGRVDADPYLHPVHLFADLCRPRA